MDFNSYDVSKTWVQAILGRWSFDFQHRRACYGVLSRIWAEITHWKGRRPISPKGGGELVAAACLVPLVFTDMRSPIDGDVLATDASETGGGVCLGDRLTALGVSDAMAESSIPRTLHERGVICIEAFAGVGGWRQAHDRLGVHVMANAVCDTDSNARRVCHRAWPGSVEWLDITQVGYEQVYALRVAAPGALAVTRGGSFSCQDVGGVSVLGKGATGARTSLFWELVRFEQIIEQVFPDLPFIDVPENVASMSAMDCDLISEGLGRHPILICSGGISRARRPRLYWPNFPVCEGPGVAINRGELHDLVGLRAPVEPTEIWVSEGWHWPFNEDHKLPTFTRSIPRRRPLPRPAGLYRCLLHEVERWE